MKKLLLLLSLLSPITSLGASGGGKVDASYIEAVRQGSAPSAPASGKARAYVLDSDGKFYVKNSSNTAKACTYSGDIVNADLSGSAAITNANLATMSQKTFKCRTTASTGVPEDCTAAQAQAIVGSTPQLLTHQSTPSTPAAGSVYVYAKNDNNLYIKDSGGTETQIVSGGGVTGFATIDGGDTDGTYGSYHCEIFTTTGDRTLTVSAAGPVMFALVGGGGGGSHGGGGGGGVIDHYWEDVWMDPGSYTVHIGTGGTAVSATSATRGGTGQDTTFAGFAAKGGGGGGAGSGSGGTQVSGGAGGSGGGGSANGTDGNGAGGLGTYNKPEVQGFAGAASPGASGGCYTSSGGGGAGAAGSAGSSCSGGAGGAGLYSVVATLVAGGTPTYWGGGGSGGRGNSGGSCTGSVPAGGTGGGGGGADTTAGTANTGGGGSGGCQASGTSGGNGGSGKAIICARIQGS